MQYEISRTDVWVAELDDQPGALAEKLETMGSHGANLEFVIVRREASKPGKAVIFVSPLRGTVAAEAGLSKANGMFCVRLEGPDRAGLGGEIARAIAAEGINIRGFSGAAIGARNAMYLAFNSMDDANQATHVLSKFFAETQIYS